MPYKILSLIVLLLILCVPILFLISFIQACRKKRFFGIALHAIFLVIMILIFVTEGRSIRRGTESRKKNRYNLGYSDAKNGESPNYPNDSDYMDGYKDSQ